MTDRSAIYRGVCACLGWLLFSVAILATRCANYHDVFVGQGVYFTDADCYARMTRVRMCLDHPGMIIRHHEFENFPAGTVPHTTALFDYLIALLALALKPCSARALDLAGAWISPLLALAAGWFLWWWSKARKEPYGITALMLFALSPMLVHGSELGRPDHQSLLLTLLLFAICAELSLREKISVHWLAGSGIAWGLALWTSLYEPAILLLATITTSLLTTKGRASWMMPARWTSLCATVLVAAIIERRPPFASVPDPGGFARWSQTIGELTHVALTDPVWLSWAGYLLLVTPFLLLYPFWEKTLPYRLLLILLLLTFVMTIWQARWAYYFVLTFALLMPQLLGVLKRRALGWSIFVLSLWPLAQAWDQTLWPNESNTAARAERRNENSQALSLAEALRALPPGAFLAPWWWSPALSYWSGHSGVGGSSHEALAGNLATAKFYLGTNPAAAQRFLEEQAVAYVIAYDAGRVEQNSGALLGGPIPENSLVRLLDRTPSRAPRGLELIAETGAFKLYRRTNLP